MDEDGNPTPGDSSDPSPGTPAESRSSQSDAGTPSGGPSDTDERLARLASLEGWRVDGAGARVHYSGATDRYSIEFYAPSDCLIYWKVPPADHPRETAVPVGRNTVPDPLRERIREDLRSAAIDPDIEGRTL